MVSPPRIEFGGAVRHVMGRGDRREEIFRDDRDRGKFLDYLAEGGERFRVKLHSYVLIYVLMEKSFSSARDEPREQLFEVHASAEDRVRELL
jgi:hypothetical protein